MSFRSTWPSRFTSQRMALAGKVNDAENEPSGSATVARTSTSSITIVIGLEGEKFVPSRWSISPTCPTKGDISTAGPGGGLNSNTKEASSNSPVSRSVALIPTGTWSAGEPSKGSGNDCSIESYMSTVLGMSDSSGTSWISENDSTVPGKRRGVILELTSSRTAVLDTYGGVNA